MKTRIKIHAAGRLLLVAAAALIMTACALGPSRTDEADEQEQWRTDALEWRQDRHERLVSPYGWLSLVGLDFVSSGTWNVGNSDAADIRMPAGPENWGQLIVTSSRARFEPADGRISVDGRPGTAGMLVQPGRSEPVWVEAADVRFQILRHADRMAVRTRWPQAETRTGFAGIDYFPFDPEWRVVADFIEHSRDKTLPFGSVLGVITDEPNPGVVEFQVDGETYRLEAVSDSGLLFFVFADATSGKDTYGGGRMLYADLPDRNGQVVLDFNRAYNPPCVFTEYSTCPLPPPENRLDVAITAGEKTYAGEQGYLK